MLARANSEREGKKIKKIEKNPGCWKICSLSFFFFLLSDIEMEEGL